MRILLRNNAMSEKDILFTLVYLLNEDRYYDGQAISILFSRGTDITYKDSFGETLLHKIAAASNTHVKTWREILRTIIFLS